MTLEQRIAKLKGVLADTHTQTEDDMAGIETGHHYSKAAVNRAFEAGADALAEVYHLRGYLEALEWSRNNLDEGITLQGFKYSLLKSKKVEAQLEALLKQVEEKV